MEPTRMATKEERAATDAATAFVRLIGFLPDPVLKKIAQIINLELEKRGAINGI